MALTEVQRKWAVGGTIAAVALAVGYGLFHSGPVQASVLPEPGVQYSSTRARGLRRHQRSQRHESREEHHRQMNGRGEYGRKHRHHRRGHHG